MIFTFERTRSYVGMPPERRRGFKVQNSHGLGWLNRRGIECLLRTNNSPLLCWVVGYIDLKYSPLQHRLRLTIGLRGDLLGSCRWWYYAGLPIWVWILAKFYKNFINSRQAYTFRQVKARSWNKPDVRRNIFASVAASKFCRFWEGVNRLWATCSWIFWTCSSALA